MFFEQIEKFQCLKLSTAQGLSHGTLRRHVTRATCPETCLKGSELKSCKRTQKPTRIELDEHRPLKYTYGTTQF